MSDSLWTPGKKVTDEDFTGGENTTISGDTGPQIRLLRCTKCKTLEELPDYQGDPRNDVVLDHAVMTHQQRHPFHDDPDAFLLRISEEVWKRNKKEINKRIWEDVKDQGFVPDYYDAKNTFMEDASKCHVRHNRQIPCIDWNADSKRIGNPTKEGWKSGAKVYLCAFCPVQAAVNNAQWESKNG